MEIRLHGRGGQGGVTCAKILASVYGRLGKSVQTFGDYAGERSGAPVRAYTRVSDELVTNRNKVYDPDHLLVLDPTLLVPSTVAGLADGGLLLVDSPEGPEALAARFGHFRVATVDATAIAQRHCIGSRSLVIVNTTIAGAFARAMDLPLSVLEAVYEDLGFATNLDAAREAHDAVQVRDAGKSGGARREAAVAAADAIVALVDHRASAPTGLQTGSWRSLMPQYVEQLAPCNVACPAGNDVVGFVQALARKGEREAAAVLGETTPLAAVCGRVCPAPCMGDCNRRELDGAVAIRALERWIADRAPVALPEDPSLAGNRRRVAVVGGGPAGLSAAYALARAGHEATILEGEAELGGVLRTGIPEFRLPRSVLDQELEGILSLGVKARCGRFLDTAALASLPEEFDAVILATGLQRLRGITSPGADLEGVEQGIRFLHRVNLEGDATLSGHVVVLGGGNTAIDCARSALRCGAASVTVAYRRTRVEMPAIAEEIEEAEEEGVCILLQRQPVAFHDGGTGRVAEVELAEVEMGEPDDSGRRRPVVTDRTERLGCDAVLLALGQSADTSMLPEGWELIDGRVHSGGGLMHVFAAGDLSTGEGTVTHAIGDGRRAADRALAAMGITQPAPADDEVPPRRGASASARREGIPRRTKVVRAGDLRLDHFARQVPSTEGTAPPATRTRGFDEVNQGLADKSEAARCFSCGFCTDCDTCMVYCPEGIIGRRNIVAGTHDYDIDLAYCKGCGICVTECPRASMEMVPTCPKN